MSSTMTAFASPAEFEPLSSYHEYPIAEMEARSRAFAAEMQRRRTTRQFSSRPVPRAVIEACFQVAGSAGFQLS
jgi:iodotyrosine deiodinase